MADEDKELPLGTELRAITEALKATKEQETAAVCQKFCAELFTLASTRARERAEAGNTDASVDICEVVDEDNAIYREQCYTELRTELVAHGLEMWRDEIDGNRWKFSFKW